MKNFMITALFCLFLLPSLAMAETVYSRVIEDLPLMPGMTEIDDSAVIFDDAAGRIVETHARTAATKKQISDFYATSLPALGWKATGPNTFVRDREKLVVSIANGEAQFKISPAE